MNKLMNYISKRGFYIVLLICVGAIALTAMYITKNRADYLSENSQMDKYTNNVLELSELEDTENKSDEDLEEHTSIHEEETFNESDEQNKEEHLENKEESVKETSDNKESNNKTEKKEQQVSQKGESSKNKTVTTSKKVSQEVFDIKEIIMPVDGKIIKKFAIDKLVYSKTLQQWSTHKGVDIACAQGTPVKAVGNGKIISIIDDDMYGITIVIDHGNDYKTCYSNLSSIDMVSEGQTVKMGDVINGVGRTAQCERSEQDHLHFEILHKDKYIDPSLYLPIEK